MKAEDILKHCVTILASRGKDRDQKEERSMGNSIAAYETLSGNKWTETEGWQFMMALKLGRIKTKFKEDDVFDLINYTALWMESMIIDKKEPVTTTDSHQDARPADITVVADAQNGLFTVMFKSNVNKVVPQDLIDIIRKVSKDTLTGLKYVTADSYAKMRGITLLALLKEATATEPHLRVEFSSASLPNLVRLSPKDALAEEPFTKAMELWGKAAVSSKVFDVLLENINDFLVETTLDGKEDLDFIKAINGSANKVMQQSDCQCSGGIRASIDVAQAMLMLRGIEELRMSETEEITREEYTETLIRALALLMSSVSVLAHHVLK